jgi:hypothetical protein
MSDDSEFVDPDDLKVQRGGDGQRLPKTVDAGDQGKIKVKPMSYGDVQEYFGDGTQADVNADQMAELFNEFIAEPELNVTPADIKDFYPLVPRDLLLAIMDASGIDADVMMEDAGQAQVNVQGNT